MLSARETERYARHLVLKGFGGEAQQRLKLARVLVVGAGGLGSPAIAYLAAAGVGTLGIADHDSVALSNLQRQILHRTEDLGAPKAASAARFASALNPHVAIEVHSLRLDAASGGILAGVYDVVLDGTDRFETRRMLAEVCAAADRPLVSGAVSMFDGQATTFLPAGPGFADLYPEAPAPDELPACEAVGVLGAVTGVIGTLMAMEAIKLVTGVGEPLVGRLLLYDGRASRFTEIAYGGHDDIQHGGRRP